MRTVVAATAVTAFVAVAQDDDFDFGDDGAAAAESSDDGEAADGESAEGEAEDGAEDGTEAAEGEETAEARPAKKSGNVKTFFILPYCRMLEGQAEVRKPGAKDWILTSKRSKKVSSPKFRSFLFIDISSLFIGLSCSLTSKKTELINLFGAFSLLPPI